MEYFKTEAYIALIPSSAESGLIYCIANIIAAYLTSLPGSPDLKSELSISDIVSVS